MATIAFIGLGNMGGPMAANLVKAGHKVVGFDLVQGLLDQAKADGATTAASAAAAVKGADVVITMLPAGKHVFRMERHIRGHHHAARGQACRLGVERHHSIGRQRRA